MLQLLSMILARKTNLNRESLYKSLSAQGNPSFAPIMKIMEALGLKVTLTKAERLGNTPQS